jgi:GT2 family glycosyltransferase
MTPTVTAAVCTRARPAMLRRALDSLSALTPPAAELIVVENAPTGDATREVVAASPGVRYVAEPVAGLDFARNRALREAQSDVVAFLDDDATADAGWAGALAARFAADPRLAVCTGRVEALSLEAAGHRLFEANGGFSRGLNPVTLPRDAALPLGGRPAPLIAWAVSIGSGASYAVRRSTALELGGFDEALDLGPALPGGGDHDLLWRALQAGWHVGYEPAALAWHEHRADADDAARQIVGHQRALVAFLTKSLVQAPPAERPPLAAFLAWRLLKPGVRLASRAAGRDPLPAGALVSMWWNCWRGLTAYPAARRIARRRAGEVA